MNKNESLLTLEALRDFFMASNSTDLADAYSRLGSYDGTPAPRVSDWSDVEFAFNRLFVGPKKLLAPPFASVYLDSEPQLMGAATLKVRYLYQMIGLTSPWQDALPDDHLSLELDAYRQLQVALNRVGSSELQAWQSHFLHRHLKQWLPKFVARVKAAPEIPTVIIFVVDQLAAWLKMETLNFAYSEVVAA